jgi:hypothetical protein
VVSPTPLTEILPTPEHMGLLETADSLLYGFHGQAKQQVLGKIQREADDGGKILTRKIFFYVIDLAYDTPDGFDESLLLGQLPAGMLNKVPFLVTKRIKSSCAEELGEMWNEWAVKSFGSHHVRRAKVDWDDVMSFIPAFPMLAENLFAMYPKLRCVVMPVRTKYDASPNQLSWVGVSPKAKAQRWVSSAEVRTFKDDIRVLLKFDARK